MWIANGNNKSLDYKAGISNKSSLDNTSPVKSSCDDFTEAWKEFYLN